MQLMQCLCLPPKRHKRLMQRLAQTTSPSTAEVFAWGCQEFKVSSEQLEPCLLRSSQGLLSGVQLTVKMSIISTHYPSVTPNLQTLRSSKTLNNIVPKLPKALKFERSSTPKPSTPSTLKPNSKQIQTRTLHSRFECPNFSFGASKEPGHTQRRAPCPTASMDGFYLLWFLVERMMGFGRFGVWGCLSLGSSGLLGLRLRALRLDA